LLHKKAESLETVILSLSSEEVGNGRGPRFETGNGRGSRFEIGNGRGPRFEIGNGR